MDLQKNRLLEHMNDLRRLWNEWDPIGVCPELGGPIDEYDSYLEQTLRLLEGKPSIEVVTAWLADIQLDRMGLPDPPQVRTRRADFAAKLKDWYEVRVSAIYQ